MVYKLISLFEFNTTIKEILHTLSLLTSQPHTPETEHATQSNPTTLLIQVFTHPPKDFLLQNDNPIVLNLALTTAETILFPQEEEHPFALPSPQDLKTLQETLNTFKKHLKGPMFEQALDRILRIQKRLTLYIRIQQLETLSETPKSEADISSLSHALLDICTLPEDQFSPSLRNRTLQAMHTGISRTAQNIPTPNTLLPETARFFSPTHLPARLETWNTQLQSESDTQALQQFILDISQWTDPIEAKLRLLHEATQTPSPELEKLCVAIAKVNTLIIPNGVTDEQQSRLLTDLDLAIKRLIQHIPPHQLLEEHPKIAPLLPSLRRQFLDLQSNTQLAPNASKALETLQETDKRLTNLKNVLPSQPPKTKKQQAKFLSEVSTRIIQVCSLSPRTLDITKLNPLIDTLQHLITTLEAFKEPHQTIEEMFPLSPCLSHLLAFLSQAKEISETPTQKITDLLKQIRGHDTRIQNLRAVVEAAAGDKLRKSHKSDLSAQIIALCKADAATFTQEQLEQALPLLQQAVKKASFRLSDTQVNGSIHIRDTVYSNSHFSPCIPFLLHFLGQAQTCLEEGDILQQCITQTRDQISQTALAIQDLTTIAQSTTVRLKESELKTVLERVCTIPPHTLSSEDLSKALSAVQLATKHPDFNPDSEYVNTLKSFLVKTVSYVKTAEPALENASTLLSCVLTLSKDLHQVMEHPGIFNTVTLEQVSDPELQTSYAQYALTLSPVTPAASEFLDQFFEQTSPFTLTFLGNSFPEKGYLMQRLTDTQSPTTNKILDSIVNSIFQSQLLTTSEILDTMRLKIPFKLHLIIFTRLLNLQKTLGSRSYALYTFLGTSLATSLKTAPEGQRQHFIKTALLHFKAHLSSPPEALDPLYQEVHRLETQTLRTFAQSQTEPPQEGAYEFSTPQIVLQLKFCVIPKSNQPIQHFQFDQGAVHLGEDDQEHNGITLSPDEIIVRSLKKTRYKIESAPQETDNPNKAFCYAMTSLSPSVTLQHFFKTKCTSLEEGELPLRELTQTLNDPKSTLKTVSVAICKIKDMSPSSLTAEQLKPLLELLQMAYTKVSSESSSSTTTETPPSTPHYHPLLEKFLTQTEALLQVKTGADQPNASDDLNTRFSQVIERLQ